MPPLVVAVVGYTGGVGTCLLAAMERAGLKPWALVRSTTMQCGGAEAEPVDFAELGKRLLAAAAEVGGIPVIADVTASSAPQEQYEGWLAQGISVVAANKGIFAGSEPTYEALLTAAAANPPARLLHETTVGAGLPVIGTLVDLKGSSHDIVTVEGVLSGTLAFVLGAVAGGAKTLSAAVAEAKELGYTEPDPRDDLNGMDVARKAVILARVSGLKGIELEAMDIESLVPEPLRECSVEDFMTGLPQFDEAFAARTPTPLPTTPHRDTHVALLPQRRATVIAVRALSGVAAVESKGERLHYAGKVDLAAGKVEVGPLACNADHPFNHAGNLARTSLPIKLTADCSPDKTINSLLPQPRCFFFFVVVAPLPNCTLTAIC